MTTLIAGASGFIGRRLRGPGDRALLRKDDGSGQAAVGDLQDLASLQQACRGVDTVFHCAGYAHAFASSDPEMHWRVNFEGTRNLLTAAGQNGVRTFVFLSSVKAMAEPGVQCVDETWPGKPGTAYGQSKRAAEELVLEVGEKTGMHVVNLRLAMVYGNGGRGNLERMARGIRAGWFPPIPETGNRRSLVHVDDVVVALRLVASVSGARGQTYIVADEAAYSGRQIYDALRVGLGLTAREWQVPEKLLRTGGRLGDMVGRLRGRALPLNGEVVERLLGSECYSSARLRHDLGWRPKMNLQTGIQEMLGVEAPV
ncbi:MAG: NAD-dependent epimerase/dehydratase family protein [Pseudomonadota bacterium]